MSDKEKLSSMKKLSDDVLEEVTGGQILLNADSGVFNKGENAGAHTALLDKNEKAGITLLGTKSVNQNSISRDTNGVVADTSNVRTTSGIGKKFTTC